MSKIFGKNLTTAVDAVIPANITYYGITDTSAPRSITLPLLSTVGNGGYYIIKDETNNAGSNSITVSPDGGDQINGGFSPLTINANGGSLVLFARDTSWWLIQPPTGGGGGGGSVSGPISSTINAFPRWADATGTTLADSTIIYGSDIINRLDNALTNTTDAANLTLRAANKTSAVAASGAGGNLSLRAGNSAAVAGTGGNLLLFPGTGNSSNGYIEANGNILDSGDAAHDIGSTTKAFNQVYGYSFHAQGYEVRDTMAGTARLSLTQFTLPSSNLAYGLRVTIDAADALGIATATNPNNDAVATQDIRVESGAKTDGTGNSGSIYLETGTSVTGTSGSIFLKTGTTASGTPGAIQLSTDNTLRMQVLPTGPIQIEGATGANLQWASDGSGSIGSLFGNRPDGVHALSTMSIGDTSFQVLQGAVATIDDTLTTIQSLTIPTNVTVFLEARVVGKCTSGSSPGVTGDSGWYIIKARISNVSGTVTILDDYKEESEAQAGWDASLSVSGTNVLVQVTGLTSNSISWRCTSITQQV